MSKSTAHTFADTQRDRRVTLAILVGDPKVVLFPIMARELEEEEEYHDAQDEENSEDDEDDEEDDDEEEEEEKWRKHYSSRHRILLVGEGDFSFSLSLARRFGSAHNMVATSLDTQGKPTATK